MNQNTEEKDLDFTQEIRKQMVAAITSSGDYQKLTNDYDKGEFLLKILGDMDRVSLGKLKIKSDNDNIDKLVQHKEMAASILAELNPNTLAITGAKNNNKRSFDDTDGSRDYVEGEMTVGVSTTTFTEFTTGEKEEV